MKYSVLCLASIAIFGLKCAHGSSHESLEEYSRDDVEQETTNSTADVERSGLTAGFCPQVCIDQGCLVGSQKVGNKRSYEAYYGIPYAAPPVGKLRFKNPEAPAKFNGLWDSTYHRDSCIHNSVKTGNIIGSEDCLYLNVYKPTGVKLGKKNRLPVLVFLHGGSWQYGNSDPDFYGPEYLMDSRKVILVIPQFRQGPFGFLSSGDPNCQGNFGLKDQNMALKWIQANIKEFGGDPDRVTLMGDNSGAAAAHLHVMSPRSDDLFHKAIFAGGYALSYWAFEKSGVEKFKAFAKLAGISRSDRSDSEKVMKKLMKMSAYDLQVLGYQMGNQARNQLFQAPTTSKVFRPVIEGTWKGAFMTKNPFTVWKSGDYQQRPYFIICASFEEGNIADIIYNPDLRALALAYPEEALMAQLELNRNSLPPIMKYYYKNNPTKYYNNTGELYKYWTFWHPEHLTTYYYTKYGDIYEKPADHLLFAFKTTYTRASRIHDFAYPENGPSNGDILLFAFRSKILDEYFVRDAADESAKNLVVKLLTTYVADKLPKWDDVYPYCTRKKAKVFCDYLTITREGDQAVLGSDDAYDAGSIKVLNEVLDTLDLE